MKISNLRFFEQRTAEFMAANQRLAAVQEQVASGRRINAPSDEPESAARIQNVESLLARQTSYQRTLTAAEGRLSLMDTQLRDISDVMLRVRELTVQAANGTLGPQDRKIIGIEMSGLSEALLERANRRDASGHYLFGGSVIGQPPFQRNQDGAVEYAGDATPVRVEIGDGRTLQISRAGTEVFVPVADASQEEGRQGFFGVLDGLIASLESNDTEGIQAALGHLDGLETGLVLAQSDVGLRLGEVDRQREALELDTLRTREVLSEIVDLDYAEAITRLRREELALEAAQGTLARIARLSLFNFIE